VTAQSSAQIGARPACINLSWDQGDTLGIPLTFRDSDQNPIDMSAYSFIAQYDPHSNDDIKYDITVDDSDAANGRLLLIPPSQTDIYEKGVWDLRQLENGVILRTLVSGDAHARKTISRIATP